MAMRWVVVVLLVASIRTGEGQAKKENGTYIFQACQASIRFQNDPKSATNDDMILSERCSSWTFGFLEAGAFAKFFCPGTVSPFAVARVYVSYMEKNPTLLDAPRGSGALLAFADAYPCPIPQKE